SFLVQQTVDGGRTWQAANLRCPSRGPCIALGAQDNARCMAIGEYQAIETSVDGGRSWKSPSWPDRLDACVSSELIGLDSGGIAAAWHQRKEFSDQRRALLSGQSCGNLSGGMVPFWSGSETPRR